MDVQAKQQVADRIKQATNILVTVNNNPSVDQLAACIGLTLLLNKLDKHATAVFSGKVPSTIEFLQPEKTIETNTDSLQDFIISLDKAKADKLRYKVEDQFVRIFITPYRTNITQKDLEFSKGDFNVEVVIALGITDQKQLDAAITAHGRILHDATVISVNTGVSQSPNLGQINWQDSSASSLSEMLVSISEAFGSNLLDNQMATAFLTGIVSETDRFSNGKTSPKVMTMSAQLMAAGANQQLIASKLEPPETPPPAPVELPPPPAPPEPPKSQPPKPAAPSKEVPKKGKPSKDGSLDVSHKNGSQTSDEVSINPNEILIDNEGNLKRLEEIANQKEAEAQAAKKQVEEALAATTPVPEPPETPPPAPVELPPPPATPQPITTREDALPPEAPAPLDSPTQDSGKTSSMPGSHTLLSPLNGSPSMETPFTANTQPEWQTASQGGGLDALSRAEGQGMIGHAPDVAPPVNTPFHLPSDQPLPAGAHVDEARNAVENALSSSPFSPGLNPVQSLNAAPITDNLHPQSAGNQPEQIDPAAPPPIPPPLMPSQGVVIPPPYTPVSNSSAPNNNLSNTL
jgi:hypothetical protein